jgi:hypothetical protein
VLNSALFHDDIWRSGVIAPPFLTSALDGDEWSNSCPGRFTRRGKIPGTHWIGGWKGHSRSAVCGEEKNFDPAGIRTPAV